MSGSKSGPSSREVDKQKQLNSLRQEYWKKMTQPPASLSQGEFVFDSGIQRFMSMSATKSQFFVGNLWKGTVFFGGFVLPLIGILYMFKTDREKNEYIIRTGQITYKDRQGKFY